MKHAVEIKITADVPEGSSDIAHEAIVKSRELVHDLIAMLEELGLTGAVGTRHIVRRSGVRPAAAISPQVATDARSYNDATLMGTVSGGIAKAAE